MKNFRNNNDLRAHRRPLGRVRKLTPGVTIIYCCLLLGCVDDGQQNQRPDSGPADAEQIVDARLIDGPAEQDGTIVKTAACEAEIGKPCKSGDDCCLPLSCMKITTGLQICTRGCSRDIVTTDMIDEDDCPDNHRCMREGFVVCLPLCTISADSNECAEGVACHPASTTLTGEADQTVCSHFACRSGKDCPVMLAGSCRVGTDNDCSRFSPDAFCLGAEGASHGRCALAGVCDPVTGLCRSHTHGDSSASVGDPCSDDRDCGGQMRCQRETRQPDGTVNWRNGYCVIEGCTFASALSERACPAGASCFVLEPGGRCLKSCDPHKPDACRGQPGDVYGDYECYDWSQYWWSAELPYSTEPICDITDRPIYEYFKQPGVGCSALALQGNPTDMVCRDLTTGAISSGLDCRCLDASSSGPL